MENSIEKQSASTGTDSSINRENLVNARKTSLLDQQKK
jgi:hypothetical protein